MNDAIDALLEDILAGTRGDGEELRAFEQAFATAARFPFPARLVGVPVEVTDVVFEGNARRGLIAVCRRGGEAHTVALADVVPGPVTVETSMLLDAYRRWCGVQLPFVAKTPSGRSAPWAYVPLAREVGLALPLKLRAQGLWDPAEQYWGEPDEEPHAVVAEIIAAGPRPEFEMEQVIPGVDEEDWDSDPVADAAELHRAGADRRATAILTGLIAQDERCIDAWVHLGNIALDGHGLKPALELFERAVGIGEQSLPAGFAGVLPWALVDNRPFLRALYGLGLCAWRQRRWDDAESIFLSRAWLDGAGTWDSVWCLDRVRGRQRWSRS